MRFSRGTVTTTPTMPRARSSATPLHRRLHVAPRLHFPTALAALPPSLRRLEPNWASGRGAGRVPARRRRRPPRSDSPASPVALVAGAASITLLGCGAAGLRVQCPGRDTPSPSSSPVRATPPGSALALRGRRNPRPRAAPRPSARSSAPALPLSPPPTLNMDSDSCAAAFHPEVSESCSPIAPNRPHPDPALPEPDPRRPSAALPSPSYPSSPPGGPTPPPTRARSRSSPPALFSVSLPRVSAFSRRRFPQVAATTPPRPCVARGPVCAPGPSPPAWLTLSPPPGTLSEPPPPRASAYRRNPSPPPGGARGPLGRGLRSARPRLLP